MISGLSQLAAQAREERKASYPSSDTAIEYSSSATLGEGSRVLPQHSDWNDHYFAPDVNDGNDDGSDSPLEATSTEGTGIPVYVDGVTRSVFPGQSNYGAAFRRRRDRTEMNEAMMVESPDRFYLKEINLTIRPQKNE